MLIVVVGIVLERLIVSLAAAAPPGSKTTLGAAGAHAGDVIAWLLSITAGLGIVIGSVMLMPAVTALVGSFFADQIADEVERDHYPADPPGGALPLLAGDVEGVKTRCSRS